MKFLVLLIFSCSVQSIPLINQPEDLVFALEDNIDNEYDTHYLPIGHSSRNPIDQCSNQLESGDNENLEQPSRLSLPTLMTLSNEDTPQDLDVDKMLSEIIYHPVNVMPPDESSALSLMPPINPRAWRNGMDDMNYIQDPRPETSKGLPYQLPSYMFENIVPSVRSLPPVSMQIYESLFETQNNYENNDNDIDNSLYLTPNVRAVRSREEELLDQLKHEAMIPNIIPTMPVPFVRAAASNVYQPGRDAPLVMVLYPGRVPDCAFPFLFGCSPNVDYERLAQQLSGRYPEIPSAVLSPEYRKEPDTVDSNELHHVLGKTG